MKRAALILLALASVAEARPSAHQPADAAPAPIPAQFPQGEAYAATPAPPLPDWSYAHVLADPRLVRLIDTALAHNQDLAAALANIEAARAQARIASAALLPEIDASGGLTHAGGDGKYLSGAATKGDLYSAQGGVAAYELDLFGHVRSAAAASRAQYLASEAGGRATRLSLIASVANAWTAYAADASLLRIARDTAANARQSVALTRARVEGGVAPLADQRKAELTLHQAEADMAAQTTALAQDVNALRLLVGADIPPETLPASIEDASAHLAQVPAGLSSAVLLRRPDVMQAEYSLRAAHAEVDVARAALFPKISLTGVAGVASLALSNLFTGGAFAFDAGGTLSYPIFRAGAGRAGLRAAKAQRDAALAAYRKSIESAFADTANVLARQGTIEAQTTAAAAARDAAAENYSLTQARYEGGIGTWLDALSAQQTLYSAQKSLVAVQLARANARVGLYRALGGEAGLR